SDDTGVGSIVNDDAATYLSVNDVILNEGASTKAATFTITRSGNVANSSSVTYATGNGSATAGSDYVGIPFTAVSFAPSEKTKTVAVTINGDNIPEPDETFMLRLSSPVGAVLSDDTGVGTIVNDDGSTHLAVNDVTINEGNSGPSPATFTITRSGNTAIASSVNYATSNGNALSGSDYTAVPLTTVTFAAGETTKTVS